MKSTKYYSEQLKNLRIEILADIKSELLDRKNNCIKFTKQGPRFCHDKSWNEISELRLGMFAEVEVGWHDETCSGKGANSWLGTAAISTELLLELHELIFG